MRGVYRSDNKRRVFNTTVHGCLTSFLLRTFGFYNVLINRAEYGGGFTYSTASGKHFTAIRLLWSSRQGIIKHLSINNGKFYSLEATSQVAMLAWIFGGCSGVFDLILPLAIVYEEVAH